MELAALLSPISVDDFVARHMGVAPLHIPAPPGIAKKLIGWSRLSELLLLAPHWTPGNLSLILNRRAVLPDFYLDDVETLDGRTQRADPAKIELFLGMGASLVANYVEQIAPELRQVTEALGYQFAALTNANVYCSFKGVQGFATHFDLHEVFAVQCEGEKLWRVYQNRADHPVEALTGGEDVQRIIDRARGPLAMEIKMRPGDVLYLPRGVYHDALAEDGASLHVTFSVAPHSGRLVLQLLQQAALGESMVRAYLPDGRTDKAPLRDQLQQIAGALAKLVASDAFVDEVIDAQRARSPRAHRVALPNPPALHSYIRTSRPADIEVESVGRVLITASGRQTLGLAFAAAEYALSRPAFSAEELAARFPHIPKEEQKALIEVLVREGLVEAYTPKLV